MSQQQQQLQALVDSIAELDLDVPAQRGLAVIRLRSATKNTALLVYIGLHTLEGALLKLTNPPTKERIEQIVSAIEAMRVVDSKYLRKPVKR